MGLSSIFMGRAFDYLFLTKTLPTLKNIKPFHRNTCLIIFFFTKLKFQRRSKSNNSLIVKPMTTTTANFKKNYRCVQSLQKFYTGGPFTVSSDGSFLVCACDDTIKIVDTSNGSINSTIEGDSLKVTALTLSPDDKLLFTSSHSKQIMVWDVSTLKCLRSWKGREGPVMSMTCDTTGGLLATAHSDGNVLVWDVDKGRCTHYFKGHKGVVTSIMFHPDPHHLLLFSGSDDTTVHVWDLVSGKCLAVLEKHFSTVTSLAVSENGWTLLSAGRDKVVNLWDLRNYEFKLTVPTYEVLEAVRVIPPESPFPACLRSNEQHSGKKKKLGSPPIYFLTVGERGVVRIWNSEGGACLFEQKASDATVISDMDDAIRGFKSAVILPLDQGLLCVTSDEQFLFYSPIQFTENTFELKLRKRLVGNNEEIVDMKFLGDEEQFLAVATNVEQVQVYDLASMSCSYVLAGHTATVVSLDTCVSTSGRTLLVTGSKDNSVRLWDQEGHCCIGVGTGHLGAVGAVAFSKKKRNFIVSGSSDHTLKVWSLDGLMEDGNLPMNLKSKAVVAAHDKDINSVAVAPNDSYACSGSEDRTACIWRLPDLVSLVVLRGHKKGIWSVEFSPVDQCVITASGDKTIKLWAISDGSCLKTFEGHASSVLRASFISRGSQFVSCGADCLVKLWAVKTNECIATYDQHEHKVWALAVGQKTEMLATGGGDTVNLWHDSTAAEKEEEFRREEEGVLKGQELENAVSDADYARAIRVAFELRKPHKLFNIFSDLCRKVHADDQVDKALCTLQKKEIHLLFEYVREWNTKPKLCHIAQFVLFRVFNILSPLEILEIKGISELLESLIPYSQRHFSRIDRLISSTLLLDYTLSAMSVIEPEIEVKAPKEISVLQHEEVNEPGIDDVSQEQVQIPLEIKEKESSKKRKSGKSRTGAEKKVRESAYTDASAISLQA